MNPDERRFGEEIRRRKNLWPHLNADFVKKFGIISISRGKSEGRPEGVKRPTAGDEPREFTSRGEGGRVPPFFEKLRNLEKKEPLTAGKG